VKIRVAIACAATAEQQIIANRDHWSRGRLPDPTPQERFEDIFNLYKEGKTHENFTHLTAWHLTMVAARKFGTECMQYARENVVKRDENGKPLWDRLGAHYYFPYTLRRDTEKYGPNVSVHAGHKFYDDKTKTLQCVVEECFGVCGMISTVASSVAQSMGCPSTTIGQPGHCALLWARPEGHSWVWQIYNDVGGLAKGTHGGNPYKDITRNVWPFYAFDECSKNPFNLMKTMMALNASNVDSKIRKANSIMAVTKCPWNIYGWIKVSQADVGMGDLSHLIQKGEVAPLKSASANLTAENGHRENRDNNELYRAAILGDQQAMANLKPTGPLSAILDGDEMYHCLQDDDTITIDFEGTADVDNIEVQWLSKAIPRKVEFFVDGSLVEAGTLRDSSVGWTDIYTTYELNQKNCSKIVMKMSESTGSFSTDGLTVRLGIRRIKVVASIVPDNTSSALCLAFQQNCVEKAPQNQARHIVAEFLAENYFDPEAQSEDQADALETLDFSYFDRLV